MHRLCLGQLVLPSQYHGEVGNARQCLELGLERCGCTVEREDRSARRIEPVTLRELRAYERR